MKSHQIHVKSVSSSKESNTCISTANAQTTTRPSNLKRQRSRNRPKTTTPTTQSMMTTGVSPKDNFATVSASINKTELLVTCDSGWSQDHHKLHRQYTHNSWHNCSQASIRKDNTTHTTQNESTVNTGSLIYRPQTSESQPSRSPTQTTESVNQLLNKYQTLFSDGPTDLGRITIESHWILLSDNIPFSQRSSKDAEEKSRQVIELLAKRLILESTSPWAAPVTLADKADGARLQSCQPGDNSRQTTNALHRGVNRKVER